jgi:hypothetical protein
MDTQVFQFATQGKDGLAVKKMFAILLALGVLAVSLGAGAVGCKTETKKSDAAPVATKT